MIAYNNGEGLVKVDSCESFIEGKGSQEMKRLVLISLLACVLFGGLIVYNNDFDMVTHEKVLTDNEGELAIEYAMPKSNKEKPGLVLFIHGDGPTNKNSDEGYYPAWERFAKNNIISVGWNKPGVGGSTGDWLSQDMTDRQKEAERVLKWALETFDVDPDKVGVWGASQGGWVITKLLNNNPDIRFAVGVAPAVNWLRQGEYNTVKEMTADGYSQEEIDKKLIVNSKVNEYLKINDYQGYLNSQLEADAIPKDRWNFIRKNMTLDNTAELAEIKKPYYLLLGDHDNNVDVAETEKIYKETIDEKYLQVFNLSEATHRMLKPRHQKDSLLTVIEAVVNPREIFSPDYLKALDDIAKAFN